MGAEFVKSSFYEFSSHLLFVKILANLCIKIHDDIVIRKKNKSSVKRVIGKS